MTPETIVWLDAVDPAQAVTVAGAKMGRLSELRAAGVTVPDGDGSLAPFLAELPDLFGVSRVHLDPTESTIVIHDLRDQPRCERSWRRDETVQQRADGGWLSDRDAEAVGLG